MLFQERQVLRLRRSAATERENARLLQFRRFPRHSNQLFVLNFTEFSLALLRKNLRNFQACSIHDPLVQVYVRPAHLPRKKLRDRRLARAHETCQADEPVKSNFHGHRLGKISRCGMARSVTLEDVDCTIEARQLDPRMPGLVNCSERGFSIFRRAKTLNVLRQLRLVVHFSFQ